MKHTVQKGVVKELTIRYILFCEDQYLVMVECPNPKKPGKHRYIEYVIPKKDFTAFQAGSSVNIPPHWTLRRDATTEWRIHEWLAEHINIVAGVYIVLCAVCCCILAVCCCILSVYVHGA